MARYLTGTIAQLSGKVSMNGIVLNQPQLSVLSTVLEGSTFRRVGIVRRDGKRGRPAIVWQIDTELVSFMELHNRKGGLVVSNKPSMKLKAA